MLIYCWQQVNFFFQYFAFLRFFLNFLDFEIIFFFDLLGVLSGTMFPVVSKRHWLLESILSRSVCLVWNFGDLFSTYNNKVISHQQDLCKRTWPLPDGSMARASPPSPICYIIANDTMWPCIYFHESCSGGGPYTTITTTTNTGSTNIMPLCKCSKQVTNLPLDLIWSCILLLLVSILFTPIRATVRPSCQCVVFDDTYGNEYGVFTSPDWPIPYVPKA